MSLGLPSFSMIFTGKAVSAIERSARGIVAIVLTDGTEGGKDLNIYKKWMRLILRTGQSRTTTT